MASEDASEKEAASEDGHEQRALSDAVRRLIERTRSTTAPDDRLVEARRAVDQALDVLASDIHPGPYAQADLLGGLGRFEQTRDPMALFPYSPLIGRGNPVAPPVHFEVKGGVVHGVGRFGAQYCGPPNHVHGASWRR